MSSRVAAIMPLFNKGEFIQETIESLLKQTYTNFDLIIIDDASVDDSIKIVERFEDSRIHLYKNDINIGTSNIGNQLFEKALEYDYAIRCDADDIFEITRFEDLIHFMEKNETIGICSSNLEYFGNQKGAILLPENDEAIKAKLFFTSGVSQGAAIFRMSIFHEINRPWYKNFESNIGEDWMLFTEISSRIKFGNINQILVHYRIHSENITSDQKNFIRNRDYAVNFIMNHFKIPLRLKDAYLMLMGLKPEFNEKKIRNDLLELIYLIRTRYSEFFGDVSFMDEELKLRVQKVICFLADKKPSLAIRIHFKLLRYSNYTIFKYCIAKLFRK